MKNQIKPPAVGLKKVIPIMMLTAISILIILSGAALGVFSLANNVSFSVLGSQIHGAIFGLVIIFLGARYFLSVRKLKAEVYKTSSKFSWDNFKRGKSRKAILKSK